MQTTKPAPEHDRLRALASSLNCLTEQELCDLYGITLSTCETWRKRHQGPAYILAGNRFLYPREAVAEDLQQRVREPHQHTARDLL